MNKAIITGGAGFIGSHLAEGLSECGYRVAIIDDLSAGKKANIANLIESGQIEFFEGSILDEKLLTKLFKGVDYVFHQAAMTSVPHSIKEPQAYHDVNARGTLNVLQAARENMVSKVIYASSSSVYGDTPTLPKTENMTPNPQSPYAVSKLTGEYYCQVFQHSYDLPTVSLRYFNVYGPRQNPDSEYAAVIPRFISNVTSGNPPVIFGDGLQTRDFTYVKDIVRANILAAESQSTGVFNIGGEEQITINELATIIIKLTGDNKLKPIYQEKRAGDIKHSLACITKSEYFGYYSKYSLKKGLSETLKEMQGE
jgi:UDP-glucose 4-epimerase